MLSTGGMTIDKGHTQYLQKKNRVPMALYQADIAHTLLGEKRIPEHLWQLLSVWKRILGVIDGVSDDITVHVGCGGNASE
jgi:hypothetical protein